MNNNRGLMTIADIANKIKDTIDDSIIDGVKESVPIILDVVNPVVGTIAEGLKLVIDNADKYKFTYLLHGLASGLNQETMMNELYNYISNDDRAFYVASMFKKVLISNSKIACFIMGIILSENIKEDKEFTQEDLIVYSAIEDATDIDLKMFYKISLNYVKSDKKIDISELDTVERSRYQLVLEYFLQKRVLSKPIPTIGDLIRPENSVEWTDIAEKLKGYLDRAKPVMRNM